MSRNSSIVWTISFVVLMVFALADAGCGGSKKPVVVGSKEGSDQVLLGEIVAQHLEHRLGRKVGRNLGMGNTATVYQALINGDIGIYPEDTGTIQATILKEAHSPDPATTFERVRNEMRRIAQAEVMNPLGIDNSWAVVVRSSIGTLSEASAANSGWKLGVTRDFNERSDGLATLNQYRLPMGAMTFVADKASLYSDLAAGKLTMVAGNASDWQLSGNGGLNVLRDDKQLFGFYRTCLLAKQDLLASDPKIQSALAELSGRIATADMQRMEARLAVDHKTAPEVASEFLKQAGLQ